MTKLMLWTGLLALALSTSACFTTTAIASTERKAFVVHGDLFSSSMYHCVAEEKKPPVCTEVKEGNTP